jgi:hypothetical protein
MRLATTVALVRSFNYSVILNPIRAESPIARTEIARRLNMRLPTAMRAVGTLIPEDLGCFHDSEPSGGRHGYDLFWCRMQQRIS